MDLRASTGALVTTPSDGGRYEASDFSARTVDAQADMAISVARKGFEPAVASTALDTRASGPWPAV